MDRSPSRRRLEIFDRAKLAAVVSWVRDAGILHHENVTVGAAALSKLAHQQKSAISEETLSQIVDFLEHLDRRAAREKREDVLQELTRVGQLLGESVMTSAGTRIVKDDYYLWCQERLFRFVSRKGRSVRVVDGRALRVNASDERTTHLARWPDLDIDVEVSGADGRRLARAMECIDRMRRDAGAVVRAFETRARRNGHEEARIELSLLRIAEPLVESTESGGVERDGLSMPTNEFIAYVRHALVAEAIVLQRPDLMHRIQQLAPQPFSARRPAVARERKRGGAAER